MEPHRRQHTPPFRDLLAEHRRLDALLLRHQALLIERQVRESRDALRAFAARLAGHIRGEDEVILPFYEAHADVRKGGDPVYFANEHRKLERVLAENTAWMDAWEGRPWPPEEVVLFLEREKLLKEILEHHDAREHRFLYPGVEAVADDEARRELLARFWDVARAEEARRLDLRPRDQGPAASAIRACHVLEGVCEALVSGDERGRDWAPWSAALGRVCAHRAALQAGASGQALLQHLDALVVVLEELTPVKRFPVRRASEVYSALHLLTACRRAAAVQPEEPS